MKHLFFSLILISLGLNTLSTAHADPCGSFPEDTSLHRDTLQNVKAIASCQFDSGRAGLYNPKLGSICLYKGQVESGADAYGVAGSLAFESSTGEHNSDGIIAQGSTDGVSPGIDEFSRGASAQRVSQIGPFLTITETLNSFGVPRSITEAKYNFWTKTLEIENYFQGFLEFKKDLIYQAKFKCEELN